MILCITANPAIDVIYEMDELDTNGVNVVDDAYKTPGGKGINVSKVLDLLRADFMVTGFIGGSNGDYVIDKLDDVNIKHDFIFTNVDTRNCIRVIHGDKQFEIFEKTNKIDSRFERTFMSLIKEIGKNYNIAVISGSLMNGLSEDFVEETMDILKVNSKIILDTNGQVTKKVLENNYKPFAIKPNFYEFKEIIGLTEDVSSEDFVNKDSEYLKEIFSNKLLDDIEIVLVTNGKYGAILKYKDNLYRISVPQYKIQRTVGSGDATVAGLAKFLDEGEGVMETVLKALSLGVLNARVSEVEKLDADKINEVAELINVELL